MVKLKVDVKELSKVAKHLSTEGLSIPKTCKVIAY